MQRAVLIIGLGLGCAFGLEGPAQAHPLNLGYMKVDADGPDVAVSLELDVDAAALAIAVPAASLDVATVRARGADLAAATYARAPIVSAAGACTWAEAAADLVGRNVTITGTARCPAAGIRHWAFPLVADDTISATFELMVKETRAGHEQLTLIDRNLLSYDLGSPEVARAPSWFVWTGVRRLGILPSAWRAGGKVSLPAGIAQLAFVIALVLGAATVRQVIRSATAFGAASVAALAGTSGLALHVPAAAAYPLLGMTIVLAAGIAATGRWPRRRLPLALGGGVVHGAAMVGVLPAHHLTLSLVGFAAGWLVGLAVVTALVTPLALAVPRRRVSG